MISSKRLFASEIKSIFFSLIYELFDRFKMYFTMSTNSSLCRLLIFFLGFISIPMAVLSLINLRVAKMYDLLCRIVTSKCTVNYYGYNVKAHDCESLLMFHPNYEYSATKLLLRYLNYGDTFIDIGAHVGRYTLIASKRVGSSGIVISLEPVPENYDTLVCNVRRNNINNVILLPLAVWKDNTIIELIVPPDKGASTVRKYLKHRIGLRLRGTKIKVKAVKLDHLLLKELKISRVDVIKIDVEDAEGEVLEGAVNVLKKFRPIILIEVHSADSYIKVKKILNTFSYKLLKIKDLNMILALPPKEMN